MAEDDDLAAFVNLLEQSKVAIEETLDAIHREYPDLEVSGYAFDPVTFYMPRLRPGMLTTLPGMVKMGLAGDYADQGCYNSTCKP